MKISSTLVLISALASTSDAFNIQSRSVSYRTHTASKLNLVPETLSQVHDVHSVLQDVDFNTLSDILSSSSHIHSDASAAAAEASNQDGGWWDSYLNLYKSSLLFVHNAIDQPIKNSGWDQTWGIAIATFTASKYPDILNVEDMALSNLYFSCYSCKNCTFATFRSTNQICRIHQSTQTLPR